MKSVREDIKDKLIAGGLSPSFGGPEDWSIYIRKEPPARVAGISTKTITLYEVPSPPPQTTQNAAAKPLRHDSFQVRVRGGEDEVYKKAAAIDDYLRALGRFTVTEPGFPNVTYQSITSTSEILELPPTEGQMGFIRVQTWETQRQERV